MFILLACLVFNTLVGMILLICLQHKLWRESRAPPCIPDFQAGDLPGQGSARLHAGGRVYERLRDPSFLDEAFYAQEATTTGLRLLRPLSGEEAMPRCGLAFVAHASHSGSTMLTRVLQARLDVKCYREPLVLIDLLKQTNFEGSLGYLRAVIRLFLQRAEMDGCDLAVVKLSSACSNDTDLTRLAEAADKAQRVHLIRDAEEVAKSSGHAVEVVRARQEAAERWATHTLDYMSLKAKDWHMLSSLFGLPEASATQFAEMSHESVVDAKRGGFFPRE